MFEGLAVVLYLAAVLGSLVVGLRYINGARPRGHTVGERVGERERDGDGVSVAGGHASAGTGTEGTLRRCGHCGASNSDVRTYLYCRSCLGRIR